MSQSIDFFVAINTDKTKSAGDINATFCVWTDSVRNLKSVPIFF